MELFNIPQMTKKERMTKGNKKKISRDNHRMKCILILDRLHQHEILLHGLSVSLRTQILNNDNRKIHEKGTRYPEINCQPPHALFSSSSSILSNLEIAPRIFFHLYFTTQQHQHREHNGNSSQHY